LGVLVRLTIENQSRNKHVESWNIRRLDEGSNPSDSTIKNASRKRGIFCLKRLGVRNLILLHFVKEPLGKTTSPKELTLQGLEININTDQYP